MLSRRRLRGGTVPPPCPTEAPYKGPPEAGVAWSPLDVPAAPFPPQWRASQDVCQLAIAGCRPHVAVSSTAGAAGVALRIQTPGRRRCSTARAEPGARSHVQTTQLMCLSSLFQKR